MSHVYRRTLSNVLLCLLILTVTFRGFIQNFIGNGTLCTDAVLILFFASSFIRHRISFGTVNQKKVFKLYFSWIMICFLILLFQLLVERTDVRDGILAYRNDVVYTIPFVCCYVTLKSEEEIEYFLNLFMRCGFIISLFAIVQFIGRSFLPMKLLVLQDEEVFTLWGSNIIRVTGLMGNTIIFGGYLILLISLSFSKILHKEGNVETWLQFIAGIVANFFTYSRASVLGMFIVVIIEYLIITPKSYTRRDLLKRLVLYVLLFAAVVFGAISFGDSIMNSIIMQRLVGTNAIWSENSNTIHFSTINSAIEVIKEYPIFGQGAGTVGYSSSLGVHGVVRDGSFWIYLVEWGIPTCCIFGVIIIKIFATAAKNIDKTKDKANRLASSVSLAFISANIYLILFSIINSAYSARSVIIFNWILASFVLILNKKDSSSKL